MNSTTDCPVLSDFPISCQGSICPVSVYSTTNQREIVNEFSFFVALWLVSSVGFWRAQNKRDMKVLALLTCGVLALFIVRILRYDLVTCEAVRVSLLVYFFVLFAVKGYMMHYQSQCFINIYRSIRRPAYMYIATFLNAANFLIYLGKAISIFWLPLISHADYCEVVLSESQWHGIVDEATFGIFSMLSNIVRELRH